MTMRAMVGVGLAAFVMTQVAPVRAEGGGAAGDQGEGSAAHATISVGQDVPPADQPLIRGKIQPVGVSFEGGAGVLGYLGGTAGLGPAWNIRVTADLSDRFSAEGSYMGSLNERTDREGSIVYTGVDVDVRYNLLLPDQAPLQPFVTAGVGYAAYIGKHGDAAAMTLPLSIGAERLLSDTIKISGRLNVRPALFDNLGAPYEQRNPPGGDTWSLMAHLGGAF
jgi:hypothetical protein